MVWLTTSRVVPGIGVTIASSAPASALSSELLPALGWPAITTLMPSRSSAPWRARRSTAASVSCSRASWPWASACCRKSISSSGKSSVASTSMRRWISASRSWCTSRENSPASERLALRAAASVLASIRSAIASAWARSILSLRKARRVNSPGCGQPQADGRAGLQAARQQQLQHHRPAVRLQLQHVLAGVGMRRREVDGQALVDGRAVGGAEGQVGRFARLEGAAADRVDHRLHRARRHAHDTHRAAAGGGGDGGDGWSWWPANMGRF